jgi:hypothetical protein
VNRQGDGSEILFQFSFEDVWSHLVQHVTELMVHFWEEDGFVKPGGVLEGDELHGVAVPGVHRLARDHPSHHGDMLPHMRVKIFGRHMVQPSQDVSVTIEGMDREQEAQGFEFVLEHERLGVLRWREGGGMSRFIAGISCFVIPANPGSRSGTGTGIKCFEMLLDSRLRGSDSPRRLVIRSL